MKHIKLHLNTQYRSLESGFECDLSGNLIVLSGLNGSGKSHIADALRGRNRRDINQIIARSLMIDGEECIGNQVLLRTFSDAAQLGDIDQTANQLTQSARDQIWAAYEATYLDPDHINNQYYRFATQRIRDVIKGKFSEQQFSNREITRTQLFSVIPASFKWVPDDIFQNSVLQIFYSHAKKQEYNAALRGYGEPELPIEEKPWILLNELFAELGFNYRFREDYKLVESGELNHPVYLHPLKNEGEVDTDTIRLLNDLSDGEKSIISLAYSSIGEISQSEVKMLVLDEYDAPLNPSLTKILFKVIEKYFVQKGIITVLITHSPATIALAPEATTFYEVFRSSAVPIEDNISRVQRVDREDYQEMQVALDKYFTEIKNTKQRLVDLNTTNQELRSLASTSAGRPHIHIITEGNNIEHIKQALTVIRPDLLAQVDLVDNVQTITGAQKLKNAYEINSLIATEEQFLYVWDIDAEARVSGLSNNDHYTAFCFANNPQNTKSQNKGAPCGIENLYDDSLFTDDVYSQTTKPGAYGGSTIVREFSKKKFLQKIKSLTEPSIFQLYQPLINIIQDLIRRTK